MEVARLRENDHVTEVVTLMKGEWSYYRGGQFKEGSCYGGHFNRRKNGHVTEVVTLMEGEWSCYRGGYFNGGRMVKLQR